MSTTSARDGIWLRVLALVATASLGGVVWFLEPEPQAPAKKVQSVAEPELNSGTSTASATPSSVAAAVSSTLENPAEPPSIPRYTRPVRDKVLAEAVRQALIAQKATQLSAPSHAATSTVMPNAVGEGNQVNQPLGKYVSRVMQEQFIPLASDCYETLLLSNPAATGAINLEFSILGAPEVGGVVVDATLGNGTTLTDAEFTRCFTESLYAVVFDAPPTAEGTVTVKQSFELAP